MSTVFAPTYANLSMGYHEIKLYDLIESNYNLNNIIIPGKLEKISRWLRNTFKHDTYKTGWPVNNT